jgi:hypothetical protein
MDIQSSFDDSLRNSMLPDSALDLAETGLDELLTNEALKHVPIVKTFIGITQVGVNIHDKLFLKKIISFLENIDDIEPNKRDAMIKKIDASKKYRLKVGEKLLYFIDVCEDYESSERLSELFKAVLKKKITYEQYLEAGNIIVRLSANDLEFFLETYKTPYMQEDARTLTHTGLVFSEMEEVEVDVEKIEPSDYDDPPEYYQSKVSGGKVNIASTPAGDTIFQVFQSEKK